jgi:hypothetical protein
VGGAHIVVAQGIPALLVTDNSIPGVISKALNSATGGDSYRQWLDGVAHGYLVITNNHASDAMTAVISARPIA